jgi:uncharacterized protein
MKELLAVSVGVWVCTLRVAADQERVVNRGQTTADMADGPVQRVQPWPETVKLLESLGAKNNHKCLSC